ncbi:MAG TPA: hypothetical protein DDW34_04205 [Clostridium sp.]|nr:hypothetical protein [Clostridium sp.]
MNYKIMFRYFKIPTQEVGNVRKEKDIIRTFTKEDIRKKLKCYSDNTFLDVGIRLSLQCFLILVLDLLS